MNVTTKAVCTTSVLAKTVLAVLLFVLLSSFVSIADEAVDTVAANETTGAKEILEKIKTKAEQQEQMEDIKETAEKEERLALIEEAGEDVEGITLPEDTTQLVTITQV